MRVLSDTFGAIGDANLIVSETGKLLADHPPFQWVRVDEQRCAASPSLSTQVNIPPIRFGLVPLRSCGESYGAQRSRIFGCPVD